MIKEKNDGFFSHLFWSPWSGNRFVLLGSFGEIFFFGGYNKRGISLYKGPKIPPKGYNISEGVQDGWRHLTNYTLWMMLRPHHMYIILGMMKLVCIALYAPPPRNSACTQSKPTSQTAHSADIPVGSPLSGRAKCRY